MKSDRPDPVPREGDTVQAVVINAMPARTAAMEENAMFSRYDRRSRATRTRRPDSKRRYELTVMLKGGKTARVEAESPVPYRSGDLLSFKIKKTVDGKPILQRNNLPPVQGALVSMENSTGYVMALVGGVGVDKIGFNRALQGLRQSGSSFKPMVYATALEWGKYDPRTVIVDEPIAVRVGSGQPEWVPENFDGGFQGPLPLRTALVKSRNIPAVKVMMDLGPDTIAQMAQKMGIRSEIRKQLPSALGASEVTLFDMTSAYSVFPNLGVRILPTLIRKITDRNGKVLEDNTHARLNAVERARKDIKAGVCVAVPQSLQAQEKTAANRYDTGPDDLDESDPVYPMPRRGSAAGMWAGSAGEWLPYGIRRPQNVAPPPVPRCRTFEKETGNMVRVMSPQAAYLMISMLREVAVAGTAASMKKMGRPDLAGKTGSTNDYTDAWFIGFSPRYTTGVWIGHDTRRSLGTKEFGAKAALPVWMDFMTYALRSEKPTGWPPLPGIEFGGYGYRRGTSLDRLLVSSPHFAPGKQVKQISPVDQPRAAPPEMGWGYGAWGGPAAYGGYSSRGGMRVLSPRGRAVDVAPQQTQDERRRNVGMEPRTQDERESIVIQRFLPPGIRWRGFFRMQ